MSITRVVAITGCDSGLGYALASRIAREGMVTVAGMLNSDSAAAKSLERMKVHSCPLDVRSGDSVTGFKEYVNGLLKENPSYSLYAVVNNAGVMTIGDFEWQTPDMIENAINVNLLGAMRVTSAFLPQLRKSSQNGPKPRIINIASHCGLQPLPGFAAYSASKAGLLAWTRALRAELRGRGSAVAFVPGGFVGSSNILAAQSKACNEMLHHLDPDQRKLFEKRITALRDYLQSAVQNANYDSLTDINIIETFVKALTDENPKFLYKVQSWRYAFYYSLLKIPVPEAAHHWLMKKFLNFPDVN
ncbi:D-beta-hydroxybutyrate dehydrogenase, mitochondrial [Leguminivora glycinivorella]|uniref:D-beta-hydroxybutyrate dehydrogenase, mitochondrial n=1 Tax=Leguminivora glycinivorella TaxID=1035111 RepID=UPI00200FD3B1|nr:D-beta-hydroxybutyrate dehydrogenase, mitochondrial [Leguminivora glycinivorella]